MAKIHITPREQEALLLIQKGYDNDEIAGSLGITLGTARNMVKSLLKATGCKNRYRLIVWKIKETPTD